jgi:chromosome segregation protein
MLIALELQGFKSFADKTRFDFPDGITVVVGPNGSGKSNVVDAIKWVLGAQSAKALRGKDMIDVIFKGSSSTGRKPANSAEATLVFDNSTRKLPTDADEVQVTRRVYRSGEGEYLINGQPCRLKDIKDLFRGTGVGVDAYSLIEQGKVDRMLQASPKDRRIIFEEAAGISRFKVKKTEALRRLQRVEQNLLRLKDIVDEVKGRLESLKRQASKAQAYREMTDRVHQLRLQLGWTEYCDLTLKKEQAQSQLAQLLEDRQSRETTVETARQTAHAADLQLHRVAERCQDVDAALQNVLQEIAVLQSQQNNLSDRSLETESEIERAGIRLAALRGRVDSLVGEVDAIEAEVQQSAGVVSAARTRVDSVLTEHQALSDSVRNREENLERLRKEHVVLLRSISDATNARSQLENQISEQLKAVAEHESQLQQLSRSEQQARRHAEQAATQLKQIHLETNSATEQLNTQQLQLEENRQLLAKRQEDAALLNGRLEGARERLAVLEALVAHQEGVDAGARQLLQLAQEAAQSIDRFEPQSIQAAMAQTVRGLVGELLECEVHLAPLIDTALGITAQAIVLSDGRIIDAVRDDKLKFEGRISMMRLDRLPARRFGERIQLDGVAGVIGRADRLIRFHSELEGLYRYLLGTTWLVDSLNTALELGHFRGAGLRFVTADCQLVEGDVSLTLGASQALPGLVARRSEMLAARQEIETYTFQHAQAHAEVQRLQLRCSQQGPAVQALELKVRELTKDFARQQVRAQQAVGRLDEIEQQTSRHAQALEEARSRHAGLLPKLEELASQVAEFGQRIAQVEAALLSDRGTHGQEQQRLQQLTEDLTAGRIELARVEQRYDANRAALDQLRRNQRERQQAVDEARRELVRLHERRNQFELEILTITSRLAEAFLSSEQQQALLDTLAQEAATLRAERTRLHKQFESEQRALDKLVTRCQTAETDLARHSEGIVTLLKRLEEDYQVGLEDLKTASTIEDEAERKQLEAELTQLRQDIASVGAVNLTALAELDELQSRYDHLHNQYEDLNSAKESLQRIIHKINADSRRLFLETLEVIRTNFQRLYRKSFGGGSADIVLEAGEDVLECGVDIIATPPGKTALSNSLLSGGEKALTAVALLLAIFEFRPSPFCVLDEVDAPFDEANIGRFVNVLSEFLDFTKFIVVTHSKKTMTAGDTLYGVTMQESGVSKQVSVRFEDVDDDGKILSTEPAKPRKAA